MIAQDSIETTIDNIRRSISAIKSRQAINSSRAVILASYGSGGGPPAFNWDMSITIPATDYRLVRAVFTPALTPVPYAQIDVRTNISLATYNSTTYSVHPDPNSANRTDRTSWVIYLDNIDFDPVSVSLLSKIRSTVAGAVTYEIIR